MARYTRYLKRMIRREGRGCDVVFWIFFTIFVSKDLFLSIYNYVFLLVPY